MATHVRALHHSIRFWDHACNIFVTITELAELVIGDGEAVCILVEKERRQSIKNAKSTAPEIRVWAIGDEKPGSATKWGTWLQYLITHFRILSFQVMS